MPRDFSWFLRIKPTPVSKLLYIGAAIPRKRPQFGTSVSMPTLLSPASPHFLVHHLVVDKLEVFFAEACSMYSITAIPTVFVFRSLHDASENPASEI